MKQRKPQWACSIAFNEQDLANIDLAKSIKDQDKEPSNRKLYLLGCEKWVEINK